MSAPHFFTPSVDGDVVELHGEDAHHAARALRIREGETISVSDGAGTIVEATVEAIGSVVRAAVTARRTEPVPHPRVLVLPAVPKSGKLELVVQKLTELGVERIRPWFAERTVVHWDARKVKLQGDRLRAVAREAAKQSRRAWLPVVDDPGEPAPLPGFAVVLHEQSNTVLRDVLPPRAPDEIGVVVGPEGGLSAAEIERLQDLGAVVAGLGSQILRAETAAIVGPALVLAHYGRLG